MALTLVLILSGVLFECRPGLVQPDVRWLEPNLNHFKRVNHRVDQMLINDLPVAFPRQEAALMLPQWMQESTDRNERLEVYFARIEARETLEHVILDRENLPLRYFHNPIFATTDQLLSAKNTDYE